MLLPPAASFLRTFLFIRSLMSLMAVSFEHFAIFTCMFQKFALNKTRSKIISVDLSALIQLIYINPHSLHNLRRIGGLIVAGVDLDAFLCALY